MADKVLGLVVGGVATSIGLVSEGISAKKKRSLAKKLTAQSNNAGEGSNAGESNRYATQSMDENPSNMAPSYNEAMEYDEEQWDLDDAQQDLNLPLLGEPTSYSAEDRPEPLATKEKTIHNVHKLTDAFMAKYPVPEDVEVAEKMSLPVILPQRRPKDRHRGFIRAYAPVLETKGIDQKTFLEFIETFDKASQASPLIQAVNLAGFAATPLAPPFSLLVSVALKIAADAASEMHSRRRTNTFLDRANNEFFRPRGLFCLVMTWNAESNQRADTVDITSTISNRVALQSSSSRTQRIADQFSSSNGNTYGDIQFPEVAPLIFPALDELADQTSEEAATKREKLKLAKNFTSEYFDRRAVAKYAGKNPDSILTTQGGPKPTFTSRYADPNHPAASGNLISLVTGGHINPPQLMSNTQQSRGMTQEDRGALGRGGRIDMSRRGGNGRPGFGGGFGRGLGSQGRGRGLENTGMGMLIGALVDRRPRDQNSSQPPSTQPQPYHSNEQRHQQDERRDMQPQGHSEIGDRNRGGINPLQQRGGPSGSRHDATEHPLAMLNPLVGIKRILKQGVLYLIIVDMPTDEQLVAADQQLK